MKTIDTELISNRSILLKKFETLTVAQVVVGHKHKDGMWHIYFKGKWHEVPEADIERLDAAGRIIAQQQTSRNS